MKFYFFDSKQFHDHWGVNLATFLVGTRLSYEGLALGPDLLD